MSTPSDRMKAFQARVDGTDIPAFYSSLLKRVEDLERSIRTVTDNIGWITAPSVPASTVAVTNTYAKPVTVYVSGGTVSAIAVAGTTTGTTSGAVRVNPGDPIAITYSAAPTWKWYVD